MLRRSQPKPRKRLPQAILGKLSECCGEFYLIYIIKQKPQPSGLRNVSCNKSNIHYCLLFRFRYLIIAIIRQQNSISGISPKSMISNISAVARAPIYRFTIVIRF